MAMLHSKRPTKSTQILFSFSQQLRPPFKKLEPRSPKREVSYFLQLPSQMLPNCKQAAFEAKAAVETKNAAEVSNASILGQ